VIGFITRGRGLTVHTSNCPHVLEADPERRVDVEWDMKKKTTRPVKINVYCHDQKGILAAITGAITQGEANIIAANMHATVEKRAVNTFEIEIENLDHLNKIINAIHKIKGVYKVERARS